MGSAIATRLMEQGHEVLVWNRSPERAAPLAEKGAQAAASPRALVEGSDAVIVMVYDDEA
ncbi:MAG: NAD(P)-dependent oxidoreductase, partial [Alphaproteobacteria bacterium]